jgi:5-methyltetrahydrofolate--homocysteine methyltransferase
MLFSMGLEHGGSPESWNLEHPDRVRSVHRGYIEAGSQIIMTNSFGANRERLGLHDLSEQAREINLAAARLARAEADGAPHPVVVAGSMGPTGAILSPLGDLSYEDAKGAFLEQAGALVEGGIDVFWIETMYDLEEARAAVEASRTAAPELPIIATMTFDTAGHTMMGVSPGDAVAALHELGVDVLGGNCGNGPDEIERVLRSMQATGQEVLIASKSNAGIPHLVDGGAVYDATPEHMAEHAIQARKLGAQIVGACCGSTPEHVRAMAEALDREDGMGDAI